MRYRIAQNPGTMNTLCMCSCWILPSIKQVSLTGSNLRNNLQNNPSGQKEAIWKSDYIVIFRRVPIILLLINTLSQDIPQSPVLLLKFLTTHMPRSPELTGMTPNPNPKPLSLGLAPAIQTKPFVKVASSLKAPEKIPPPPPPRHPPRQFRV